MKKILAAILIVFLLFVGWILFRPYPIDPVAFHALEAPEMAGPYAPNEYLRLADHFGAGMFDGPEDMALDVNGAVYGGTADGKIIRKMPGGVAETFAETGGRPLGMAFDAHGNLIVADAWKGLLSIDPDGVVSVLSTEADGVPFRFTDDLDIAENGIIYFSDASSKFHQPEYLYDLLEARPHGRLLKYDPESGETTTLLDGLYFANGVAVSKDQDFVLVNETYRYRITRYWLAGPDSGKSDVFIDNLPGFPDNISATGDGRFWVAMFTVRNPDMDALHRRPFMKKILSRLPASFWPEPVPYGFVIELDEAGNVLRTLQDPGGEHLHTITSVKEIDGTLYMGSLYNDRIGVLPLEEVRSER